MTLAFITPCHKCGEPAVKQCDACDKHLCMFCAVFRGNYFVDGGAGYTFEDSFDYCPEHAPQIEVK